MHFISIYQSVNTGSCRNTGIKKIKTTVQMILEIVDQKHIKIISKLPH